MKNISVGIGVVLCVRPQLICILAILSLIQVLLKTPCKAVQDGPNAWDSAIHVEKQGEQLGSWLQRGPAPANVANWKSEPANGKMEILFLLPSPSLPFLFLPFPVSQSFKKIKHIFILKNSVSLSP